MLGSTSPLYAILADYGQVSFNPGVWSGGTTSLLWDILLALGYRIGADMLAAAWVLGALAYVAVGTAFYYVCRVPDCLKEHRASYLVMPEPTAAGQTDLRDGLGITQNDQPTAGSEMAYVALTSFEIDPYISWLYEVLTYQFYPAYRKVTVYAITLQP